MESVQAKYRNIKSYLSLILSPLGKESFELNSWVIKDAMRISQVIDKDFLKYQIENDPSLEQQRKALKDFEDFKAMLDPSDVALIDQVNSNMNTIVQEVQNKSSYDPSLFYETYFNQIGLSEKTNLSPEQLTSQFSTFNDWFSGSVVVAANKEPLLVYHGRNKDEVTRFSFDKFPAKYFAENKTYAEWFQKANRTEGTLYQCYLRVLNPIDLTDFGVDGVRYEDFVNYMKLKYGYELPENKMLRAMADHLGNEMWTWRYLRNGVDWLKYIIKDGKFDGIHFYENNPDDQINGQENTTPAWMVFHPNQIKSAQGNILNNINSKDIRFKKGGTL
jgi:hypothetical protein